MGKKSKKKKYPSGAVRAPKQTDNRNWPPEGQLGSELRFSIGTQVLCLVDEWRPGRITRLWYRESDWPKDRVAPYQILLENGGYIYAPKDTDAFIKMKHPFPYMVKADQAKAALDSEDYRKAADLYLDAVHLAPDVWTARRYSNFADGYCKALWSGSKSDDTGFSVTNQDILVLKNFLSSKEEPLVFRVTAASTLASIDPTSCSTYVREGIALCDSAKPADKRKKIFATDTVRSVGDLLVKYREKLLERQNTYQKKVILSEMSVPVPYKQRLLPGGDKCDCCGKTLLEAFGVTEVVICERCDSAYYCSADCRERQWKAGHDQACRKQHEVYEGDIMMIRDLVNKPEFNCAIVSVVGPDCANEGRWRVREVGRVDGMPIEAKNRIISVATKNLFHIRPAI